MPDEWIPVVAALPPSEAKMFVVLNMMACRCEKYGTVGQVIASISELAELTKTSRSQVRKLLRALVSGGLLKSSSDGKHDLAGGLLESTWWTQQVQVVDSTSPLGGLSKSTKSPQPQPSIDGYEPSRGREVERKRGKRGKRAAKAAPPFHPLRAHVRWDKSAVTNRLVLDDEGFTLVREHLATLASNESLKHQLTPAELQEGLGRLEDHLGGQAMKRGVNLPYAVFGWFATDLRRKNNHPQRGKPLAQRIDEKTRERMNDGIEESGQKDNGFTQQLLESGDFRRHS